jgi:acetolactate synthase-1/2/3 large subunit
MGSGLPMAHGVQLARPDATVVSIAGDGAFLVHGTELSVASQHQLPVIHVVIDNGCWKSVAIPQARHFGRSFGVTLRTPNYTSFAASFGCDGYDVADGAGVRKAIRSAVERRRPAVVGIKVDPSVEEPVAPEIGEHARKIFPTVSADWPMPRNGA